MSDQAAAVDSDLAGSLPEDVGRLSVFLRLSGLPGGLEFGYLFLRAITTLALSVNRIGTLNGLCSGLLSRNGLLDA